MTSNDKINSLEETLFLVDNFEFLKRKLVLAIPAKTIHITNKPNKALFSDLRMRFNLKAKAIMKEGVNM
jgi:hypothetical protein